MADLTIETEVDLTEVDLTEVDLTEVDLTEVDLSEDEPEDTEKEMPDEIPGPLVCAGTVVKGVLTTLWNAIKPSDE